MKIILLFFLCVSGTLFSQSTILWEVTHQESKDTSYFLGTYHYMGNGFVDTIPQILNALDKAEIVIFESLDTKESTIKLIDEREEMNWAKEKLSKRKFRALESVASGWEVNWKKLYPFEVKLKLFQSCIFEKCGNVSEADTSTILDTYLQNLALLNKKKVIGLENAQFQSSVLSQSQFNEKWKRNKKSIFHYLKILANANSTMNNECAFAQKYRKFDLNYQFDQTSSDSILIDARNDNWMPELIESISSKPCFVVVGLFHLYFNKGLIVQFRQRGFKVEPVSLEVINH